MVCIAWVPISCFAAFGWKCNAWLRGKSSDHSRDFPQISSDTHLDPDWLSLSLEGYTLDPIPNQIISETRTRTCVLAISSLKR